MGQGAKFAAGGPTDVSCPHFVQFAGGAMARSIGDRRKSTGSRNHCGHCCGRQIADGYTMLVANPAFLINPAIE